MEACMTTGRECVIIEKDEANYSTIVSRYEELKEKMQSKKVEEKL